jgi:hypothetical protein
MSFQILNVPEMERVLRHARTVAVLGIKPDTRRDLDAHQIPLYMQKVGYQILPVPTRYPDAKEILGVPVRRSLSEIASVDVLNIFCKPADLSVHLESALRLRPGVVWFQSGLLDEQAAQSFAAAGIPIAEDCIGCRRASMEPSTAPLERQPT